VTGSKDTIGNPPPARPAQRESAPDTMALGIAAAAIILFVGTGGATILKFVESLNGRAIGPDNLLASALLLNIALILFGWRRYRQLTGEVALHRKAEELAMKLAERDPLTGFLNRRCLAGAATALIESVAERGEVIAVLMADLDRFKQINDVHGHVIGDEVLRRSAARIAALLPSRSLTARIGGDEFVCLVPFDPRHPERVDALAASLIENVAQAGDQPQSYVGITVSVGIARSDRKCRDAPAEDEVGAWLHAADIAMYHAKREGRNRFCWFDPASSSRASAMASPMASSCPITSSRSTSRPAS
jgi:diguanylate cyclase (GGDEF)-like protein